MIFVTVFVLNFIELFSGCSCPITQNYSIVDEDIEFGHVPTIFLTGLKVPKWFNKQSTIKEEENCNGKVLNWKHFNSDLDYTSHINNEKV